MNVLITDGDNRAALAITRSLGRKGHRIVVGEKTLPSLSSVSRYCSEGWMYPDPLKRPDDFLDDLLRTVKARGIDVLLPVTEITTGLVTENAGKLDGSCRLPFPENNASRNVLAFPSPRPGSSRRRTSMPSPCPDFHFRSWSSRTDRGYGRKMDGGRQVFLTQATRRSYPSSYARRDLGNFRRSP